MCDGTIINAEIFLRGKIKRADIAIEDGRIREIGIGLPRRGDIIDAHGLLVLPGVVDVHVHFRDLHERHKEDWFTGSCSAVVGGVTTVIDHPNTDPPTTNVENFKMKLEEAKKKSIVDFGINAGIDDLSQMEKLKKLGVTAFGEIFMYNYGEDYLIKTFKKIKEIDAIACVHAEDMNCINKYPSRPSICEEKAIGDVLGMARDIKNMKIHVCHLSTGRGLELIRDSSATVEVTPHHLFLSNKHSRRVNPPLRSDDDRRALWNGLERINIIASDHAPHLLSENKAGFPGVETMLPLLLEAVKDKLLILNKCVSLLASNPARIFGLKGKGDIQVGNDADLVVVDMNEERRIDADELHSKSGWTPFEHMRGIFPKMTFVRGTLVYDGDIIGKKGSGKFISVSSAAPSAYSMP
jgi:dihydroorotase